MKDSLSKWGNHYIGRRVFSLCLTHYCSPESERGFYILKHAQFQDALFFFSSKFSGANFRLCILWSWIQVAGDALLQLISHIVSININADMSKLSKHNKLHKRILLCFITMVFRRKYLAPNKGICISGGEQATKAFRILRPISDPYNENHLICYLAVRHVAERNFNYPMIYWQINWQ